MPDTVLGLPLHPLVVHAVLVLVPLAGIGAIVLAVGPMQRAKYGLLVWLLTTAAAASAVVAKLSGETLQEALFPEAITAEAAAHADLGSSALWFVAALWGAVTAMLLLELDRSRRSGVGSPVLPTLLAVVTVVVAMLATGQVVRAGWSGAESRWGEVFSSPVVEPIPADGGGRHA